MNLNLTAARLIGILAALGAGVTAFTGAVTSSGGYKGAIVAAFAAISAVWIHEEHSTDRNATTASTQLPAPAPAPHPADLAAATQAVAGLLGGAPPGAPGAPPAGVPAGSGLSAPPAPAGAPAGAPPA